MDEALKAVLQKIFEEVNAEELEKRVEEMPPTKNEILAVLPKETEAEAAEDIVRKITELHLKRLQESNEQK